METFRVKSIEFDGEKRFRSLTARGHDDLETYVKNRLWEAEDLDNLIDCISDDTGWSILSADCEKVSV